MAKNGARSDGQVDSAYGPRQMPNPMPGKWVKRDPSSGRFKATKEAGGSFKHIRRER